MKTRIFSKWLLLSLFGLLLFPGQNIQAQDAPQLIISEWSLTLARRAYIEITNMGDTPVNLKDFEVGAINQWTPMFQGSPTQAFRLNDYVLEPDSSYVVGVVDDWYNTHRSPFDKKLNPTYFNPQMVELIDQPNFIDEHQGPGSGDSISLAQYAFYGGAMYLKYWDEYGTSIVVDAINNTRDENGNFAGGNSDIAGIKNASHYHVMVRKANIVNGEIDWSVSRGTDKEDSQWLVIPFQKDWTNPYRKLFTTIGHHGVAELTPKTFSSETVDIDFDSKKLTIPWGIYRDSLMFEFNMGPGLAWNVLYSKEPKDSTFNSVQSSDTLLMYVVGNELTEVKFSIDISVGNDANHVMPLNKISYVNSLGEQKYSSSLALSVTENDPVMDSITSIGYGFRVDSLFKYLEKAPNADWEIVWLDGAERLDLMRGDILKVTAENGDVKEYYIATDSIPEPSHDATLKSITWPDVPEYLKLTPEWNGSEVIPGFQKSSLTYQLEVPYGSSNIPALNVTPTDLNAQITVDRATNIRGSIEDRTTVITVLAEDDSTQLQYSVIFTPQVIPSNVQPYYADPFFSQFLLKQIERNSFAELYNPGNQDLDLSHYMVVYNRSGEANNPAEAISFKSNDFLTRYKKYIFGYQFVSALDWPSKPGYVIQDPAVDPIIAPGEVFVVGHSWASDKRFGYWSKELDVMFKETDYDYDDTEFSLTARKFEVGTTPGKDSIADCFMRHKGGVWTEPIHLFKILNDSILQGTKGVGDPADFELIDMIGGYSFEPYNVNGNLPIQGNTSISRKPEINKGNINPNGSFADTPEASEWTYVSYSSLKSEDATGHIYFGRNDLYNAVGEGIGSHYMDPVTVYKSTISSVDYLVSDGYTTPQKIVGVAASTNVSTFMENIIKADTAQSLTVLNSSGNPLTGNDVISDNDTLKVLSADSVNTTKYVITVSDLDDNAVLTAKAGSGYEITISGSTGTIAGITPGTTITEVLANVVKPTTAVLNVINQNGDLVPLTVTNFDTVKIDVEATHLISFEVVAQNNSTIITYQLVPDVKSSDAYLLSDMYVVDEDAKIVSAIPKGTRVPALFELLKPNMGATMELLDHAGNKRELGDVVYDDKVVVTSEDKSVSVTYYLKFLKELEGKLAYVNSSVLTVSQVNKTISDVEKGTTVDGLLSVLEPAKGATMVVLDADGNETSSGTVTSEYKVQVTSGDGSLIVTYNIDVLTSLEVRNLKDISVYPNPTTGKMFIVGLREHCVVRVYDINGQVLKVYKSEEIQGGTISISDQPAGVYFVSVTSGIYHLRTLKVLKQ